MALPNWANGAAEWAKGHKAQAAGIGAGALVLMVFLFSGGEGPGTVDPGPAEDDLFGAGALPEDVTTASALNEMQAHMEQLRLDLGRQKERDSQLEQALRDQVAMLSTQMKDQERGYTDQLEAALEQAIALARQTERQAGEAMPWPICRRRCRRCASCGRAVPRRRHRRPRRRPPQPLRHRTPPTRAVRGCGCRWGRR